MCRECREFAAFMSLVGCQSVSSSLPQSFYCFNQSVIHTTFLTISYIVISLDFKPLPSPDSLKYASFAVNSSLGAKRKARGHAPFVQQGLMGSSVQFDRCWL